MTNQTSKLGKGNKTSQLLLLIMPHLLIKFYKFVIFVIYIPITVIIFVIHIPITVIISRAPNESVHWKVCSCKPTNWLAILYRYTPARKCPEQFPSSWQNYQNRVLSRLCCKFPGTDIILYTYLFHLYYTSKL